MIIQSRASLKAILPHDWLISRLGLHGKFMSGSAFPDQFQGRCNEEIPFYKVADLARSSDGVHMPEPMHTISDETRKRLKAKLIPKGSIVYAKIGAASLLNRRRVTTRSCCIDNNMTAFVPEQVSPEWALIWLRSLDFGAYMCPATVPSISEGIQADLPLGLPPMEYEQRSIALLNERLPKIDKLITLLEDKSSALSSYRQSLITRAVTKGLDHNVEMKDSGVEWIGSIPREWKTSKISFVSDVTLGKMLCPRQTDSEQTLETYLCAGSISWDGVKDYIKEMWFSSKEKSELLLIAGDVLVVEGGAGFGMTTLYKGEHSPCYFQNSIIRVRGHHNVMTSDFINYWMRFTYTAYLKKVCNEATFSHYTKEKVSETPILVPPLNEQKKIADFCKLVDERVKTICAGIENQISKLNEYRSSLISAAVTGQLAIDEEVSA